MRNYLGFLLLVGAILIAYLIGYYCDRKSSQQPQLEKLLRTDTVTTVSVDTIFHSVSTKPIVVYKTIPTSKRTEIDTLKVLSEYLSKAIYKSEYSDSTLSISTYDTVENCRIIGRKWNVRFHRPTIVREITNTVIEQEKKKWSYSAHLLYELKNGNSSLFVSATAPNNLGLMVGYNPIVNSPVIGIQYRFR